MKNIQIVKKIKVRGYTEEGSAIVVREGLFVWLGVEQREKYREETMQIFGDRHSLGM